MNHGKDRFQISWLDWKVVGLEQKGSGVSFDVDQQEFWKAVWSQGLQTHLQRFLPELGLSVVLNKAFCNRWDLQQ